MLSMQTSDPTTRAQLLTVPSRLRRPDGRAPMSIAYQGCGVATVGHEGTTPSMFGQTDDFATKRPMSPRDRGSG